MKENEYKFPVPLLPTIFYTRALRRIRTSSLVFPISYESYRFILSNIFLIHKNRIKMYAWCTHTNISIYIIYYYTANGINLWSIEFTIKYMTVITAALSSNRVTTQLYRHGIRITNQTKKRIPIPTYVWNRKQFAEYKCILISWSRNFQNSTVTRRAAYRTGVGRGCSRRFNFRCRDKICVDVFDSSRPAVAATAFVVDNNRCWPNYH